MSSTLILTNSVSSLQEDMNNKLSNSSPSLYAEGQYQFFHSLAGKVIMKRSSSENIYIRFPNSDIFQKYLTNYSILKNYLELPEIVHTNFNELVV